MIKVLRSTVQVSSRVDGTCPHVETGKSSMLGSLGLVIGLAFVPGCSEEVPIVPPVEEPFTMFGIMNPRADTQAVLVYPVQQETLRPIGPEPLDATVSSTETSTGRTVVWQDSVVSDGPAGYSHVYWADFRAEMGRSYRIEATRSDGATSFADVSIPELICIEEDDDGSPWLHVRFRGERFRMPHIELTFSVVPHNSRLPFCPVPPALYHYRFTHAGEERKHENGWDLTLDLREHVRAIMHFLEEDTGDDFLFADLFMRVGLYRLRLDVLVADEAWTLPPGMQDLTLISHPETLTNVTNGFGFVGGGYREDQLLYPSRETLERSRLSDCLLAW